MIPESMRAAGTKLPKGAGSRARRPPRLAILLLVSMRPLHWMKNGFVLAPLAFSGKLLEPEAILRSAGAFGLFCALSGAVYLLNDVVDRERDSRHPRKRRRPIASGLLSHRLGAGASAAVALAALAASWALGPVLFAVLAAYGALNLAYNYRLKHVVLLDVLSVAAGFVLRVLGGSAVIGVSSSPWLLLCTLLVALFIALAKRKHELVLLRAGAGEHRAILDDYGIQFLDQILTMTATSTLVTYSLYTFFSPVGRVHPTLMLTIPFVLYGLYRYMYLIHQLAEGGSPEELVLRDRPLALAILGWVATTLVVLYAT